MTPTAIPDLYTLNMTDAQRARFYAEYQVLRKDEVVGILLAFFLGSFGAHHFYLRRNGLGVLYACFFWTGIPGLVALVECFFMPGRVREWNAAQATLLANTILSGNMPYVENPYAAPAQRVCFSCGNPLEPTAVFCPSCGAKTA